jgi:hypothetical protein
MTHWSEPHVAFIRQVVPELAHVPLYLLRNDESDTEWEPSWMAAFSPLADLQSRGPLESIGLWRGRGICIIVRDDFESWSPRCKIGTLLHEVAHGIEHLNQPEALASMEALSPIALEILNGCESELLLAAGIDRNALIRGQHGAEFVRLGFHLYWRARKQVILCPNDLQFLHSIYSLSPERYEDAVEALAYELARSVNLNLLMLREAPAEFLRLFT